MISKPLISVIIPVYNTPTNRLARCVESILQQEEYTNIEILLIDDDSTEDIKLFERNLDEQYQNVCFIQNEHAGVSRARNTGLCNAKGEIITFIDSDDYVASDFFLKAVKLMTEENADVVVGGLEYVYKSQKRHYTCKKRNIISDDGERTELVAGLFDTIAGQQKYVDLKDAPLASPCGRLYKKEVVENKRFHPQIGIFEDMLFNLEVFLEARKIVVVPNVWYSYVQYANSSIHATDNLKLWSNIQKVCEQVDSFLKSDADRWGKVKTELYLSKMMWGLLFTDFSKKKQTREMKCLLSKWHADDMWDYLSKYSVLSIENNNKKILAFLFKHKMFSLLIFVSRVYVFLNKERLLLSSELIEN